MRNTRLMAAAFLCLFLPCLAAKIISVRGEITCDGCNSYTDYTIELQDVNSHRPSTRVLMRGPGDFDLQLPEGAYMLTVSDERQALKTEMVNIGEFQSNRLSLRLPNAAGAAQKPGTGVISALRLKHKVPKQAAKEYSKAHDRFVSGDIDGSLDHLRRAVEIDPEYMEAWNNLGCQLLMKNRPQQSLAAFEGALALDAEAPLVHTNIGIVLLMMGKPDQAEHSARRAMKVDPGDRKARYVLGLSLYAQRQYTDETIKLLREAVESMPQARTALAHALSASGQPEAARVASAGNSSSAPPAVRKEAKAPINSMR